MPDDASQYKVRDRGRQARRGLARGRRTRARRQQAAPDGLRAHRRSSSRAASTLSSELKIPGFGGRVKLKDVAVFSRQFATMINSGPVAAPVAVHPRRADREQGARRGRRPGAHRRRAGLVALAGARPSTRRSFNRLYVVDGAGRRDRRRPRHRAHAARRHDREAGRAAPQDQVGDDLPGRRARPRAR